MDRLVVKRRERQPVRGVAEFAPERITSTSSKKEEGKEAVEGPLLVCKQ